jgi:hypothetical protein
MLRINKLCVCGAALACVAACSGPVDTVVEETTPAQTVVTPHLLVPVGEGRNVVYSATFQLAWDAMSTEVIEEAIELKTTNEMARHLNDAFGSRTDLAAADYLVLAGVGEGAVGRARRALKQKYGAVAPALSSSYEYGLFAYAILDKRLRFEHPFEVFPKAPALFGSHGPLGVRAFGVYQYEESKHVKLKDQVEVLHYAGTHDFAIRLVTTNPEDELIIARIRPGETLRETIDAVESRVSAGKPERLDEGDILIVPNLDASFSHAYTELMDLYLANDGWEEYYIHDAVQDIRFSLDENGVSVESDMKLAFRQKGPPPEYRLLVCHAPFLVYLKQKDGKDPYFAVWVDNQELMIPSS